MKKEIKVIKLANKATMNIPINVIDQVDFLHRKIGSVEWSGILLVKIEGSINNLTDLEVDVKDIFLCDIGTSVSTSYDNTDHYEDLWELFPDYDFLNDQRWDGKNNLVGYKMCQCHTHHTLNGGAYFSGTDMDDLKINSSAHGLYISLIFDAKGNYVAKGSFEAKIEENLVIKAVDFPNNNLSLNNQSDQLITFDFKINQESVLLDDWFVKRYELIEEKKARLKTQEILEKSIKISGIKQTKNYSTNHVKNSGYEEEFIPGLGVVYTSETGALINDLGIPLKAHEAVIYNNFYKSL